jgi:hypothetical protein
VGHETRNQNDGLGGVSFIECHAAGAIRDFGQPDNALAGLPF